MQQAVREGIASWTRYLAKARELEAFQARAIRRLALLACAAQLATEFGTFPIARTEVASTMEHIRDLWLDDTNNLPEAVRGMHAVREFILRHSARFQPAQLAGGAVRTPVYDVAGFVDRNDDLYLFTDGGLKEACRGFDMRSVVREMDRRGLLHRNNKKHLKCQKKIDGVGETQFYAVESKTVGFAEKGKKRDI